MHQYRFMNRICKVVTAIVFLVALFPDVIQAQQIKVSDFVLFGGSGGVELSSSTNIQGGTIGSSTNVKTNGNATLNANIYSGGTVMLSNSNTVTGKIAAANTKGATGSILTIGSSASIGGNIDVKGNIVIGGGKVSGKVTHPTGTTYSGPAPAGGNITGPPTLPVLPALPAITVFQTNDKTGINSSKVITPGAYGDVNLSGKKTLTFSGPGVYIFNSITNFGSPNNFVFDFTNGSGTFQIYIYNDASLDNINATTVNGGDASKIFTEVHGNGSTTPNAAAFNIANGSSGNASRWLGTVWAPNGSINIGSGTGSSYITGALLSGTKVSIQNGVTINYTGYSDGTVIFPYYPPPNTGKVNDLLGAELNALYSNSSTLTDPAQNIFIISHDSVMIEVIAKIGQVAQLTALLQTSNYGMTHLINNGPNSLIVTGNFPIANLPKLDSLTDLIDYCRPLFPPISNTGLTNTNGDLAIHSDFVRNGYNVSGQGVKVGVISDSYNTIPGNPSNTDVVNGDLPGVGNPYANTTPVQVLQDYPFGRRSDEGRAMLQIVHDIAPKAQLGFRTGFISAGDFAQGIRQFQQNNYNVIVDDVTYITEPFFTDGTVAQAVNDVVAQGVSYFAAAGNYGHTSYQGAFKSAPAPAGFVGSAHNFNNSGGSDIYQSISLTPGTYTIVLQWQDDLYSLGQSPAGTQNDLDQYLVKPDGSIIGFNRNNIGGDPIEILPFTVTANTLADLMIIRAAGNTAVNFKYIVFRGNVTINEYQSVQSTIVGQANAAGAMTVGAIRYNKTPAFGGTAPYSTDDFTSLGGTTVNGVIRNKPDFTGPDGVNTTVNFSSLNIENDAFPNFFGTSAAAPHAAGVAALLIESQSKFASHVIKPAEMKSLLQTTALDINSPGFDLLSGAGLIQAQAALATFAAPTPVATSLTVPSNIVAGKTVFTVTVNGNYFSDSTKVLFRGSPLTTTVVSSTQLTASIPLFTGNPAIQASTKPKSVNGNDGGISQSVFFFTIPKKQIVITADNKSKKYGEKIPAFTSTITVDGVALASSGLTLADLGLTNISYTSPATDLSNVGKYFIKASRTFDATNPTDAGLTELYDYSFKDGLLTINQMPLKITPKDKVVTYGNKINNIGFNYLYDNTNIDVANRATFLSNLVATHTSNLVDTTIAYVNGKAIVVGRTLTAADLQDMSFLASGKAIVAGKALVAGSLVTNMNIIELDLASIFNYEVNDSTVSTLVNGKAIVAGKALVAGKAIVAGKAMVAGTQIVNSANVNDTSNNNVVVIIDSADVNSSDNAGITTLKSINLVTGIHAGQAYIVPGALLSENFAISYGLGNLTILPAALTVQANDTFTIQGSPIPAFRSTISGFVYNDNTVVSGPQYTLSPLCTGSAGVYSIIPNSLVLSIQTDYTITYLPGNLYINPKGGGTKNVKPKLDCVDNLVNDPSGLKYVAHFSYINPNATTIYVPVGVDNSLLAAGSFSGTPPQVFLPTGGTFDIPFDGNKLEWLLSTYNGNQKTAVASDASSTSSRCSGSVAYNPNAPAIANGITGVISAYPNPVTSKVRISVNEPINIGNNFMLFDLPGKPHAPKAIRKISSNSIELDVSNLSAGVYFIKIQLNQNYKTFKIIKL